MIRGDLSNRLIHLTKGNTLEEASTNFLEIVRQGKLIGGTGHIRGGYTCVCFSEAPITVLSQVLSNPTVHDMRYAPLGIMVQKQWLFERGGRPVIYQSDAEFELLPEELKYRHVRYEPQRNIDHTWEREWRIKAPELVLDPTTVTFVVPTREWEERFKQQHADDQQGMALALGDDAWLAVEKFRWHFIVLEDLGVEFQW
ncbi:MAG TPA: hypothetical protein PLK99_03475 [Burkholderiales bacterium]|nr:hypothetical protein [Burkholderiales bacterium]